MKTCLLGILLVLLLLTCVCIVGYAYLYHRFPPQVWQPRFGMETNPARTELGIPVIPDSWTPHVSQYETIWRSPQCRAVEGDVNQRKLEDRFEPCYREKVVRYWPTNYPESDQIPDIIEEIDLYLGPGYVDILGELEREFVNIVCRYNPNDPTWKDCEAGALVANKFGYGSGGEKIDMSTAIQILYEWGIPYP